jgi:hypothetical protein
MKFIDQSRETVPIKTTRALTWGGYPEGVGAAHIFKVDHIQRDHLLNMGDTDQGSKTWTTRPFDTGQRNRGVNNL